MASDVSAGPVAAAAAPPPPVRLWDIAVLFGLISLTAFGGGQKAQIRSGVVKNRHWMTDAEFIEGLEIAQVMPGPNIINLAVYVGHRMRGVAGAAVALAASSTPAFVIVLIAGAFYFSKYNNAHIQDALKAAAAGAVGLTIANAFDMSREQLARPLNILFIVATAVCVSHFKWELAITLTIFGSMSMTYYALTKRKDAAKKAAS